MRFFPIFLIFIFTAACSIYQSDGRKFLEKHALQFAATANLQSCGGEPLGEEWVEVSSSPTADVFSNEKQDFTLRIVAHGGPEIFHCTYQFASVQEMIERTDSAVELTLERMVLGLGGFAFFPITPLK